MTPSESIIAQSIGTAGTVDSKGRRLTVRRLRALDTLRLFKAAGPVLALNESWLSMAALAFAIQEIDGVPVPTPATEAQIESLIERLGDEGLAAIADTLKDTDDEPDSKTTVGNLPGIPC